MPKPPAPARREFLKLASLAGGSAVFTALAQAAPEAADAPATFHGGFINVRDHGIVADGRTKNTAALNRLIERVAATGGGTIFFPAGRYLTGPLVLLSHITLHLDAGAVLEFSDDFADYLPMVPGRWQGLPVNTFQPLIRAHRARHIGITGRGEIDGHGARWWEFVEKHRAEGRRIGQPPASRWVDEFIAANPAPEGQPRNYESFAFMRPPLFQPVECEQVFVSGLVVRNSPFWTIHPVNCENVVVDGISVYAPDSPNTDGVNPESCRNVRIANCRFDNDDDCITIKAGKNEWGRKHAGPCENIVITNCIMTRGAAGVGLGSEMSGGIRNVTVSNCVFDRTMSGVHLKANRGRGGVIEDVIFSNLVMNRITHSAAIHVNLEYWIQTQPGPFGESTPVFRNVQFSHIRGTQVRKAVDLTGLVESRLRGLALSDLDFTGTSGLVAKHVDELRLDRVRIAVEEGAPFSCESCSRVQLRGVETITGTAGQPQILLHNVERAVLGGCGGFETDRPLLGVSGEKSAGIRVLTDNAVSGEAAVKVSPEVPAGAVGRA